MELANSEYASCSHLIFGDREKMVFIDIVSVHSFVSLNIAVTFSFSVILTDNQCTGLFIVRFLTVHKCVF